jgi:transcriptional regulator with XRE-family HTH domain
MKMHRWSDIKDKGMTPTRIARADAEVAREAMSVRLGALRKAVGLTQAQMAKRASAALSQSQLSRLETSENIELRSIFRYAQAAKADRVEVSAVVGGKRIPIVIMTMNNKRKHGHPVKTRRSSSGRKKGGSEAR